MSKAETAVQIFDQGNNCAQAVFLAYAEDFGMDKNLALSATVGFGGGMGRTQDVCGAVSGAIMVLGLGSGFKEGDGRDKINLAYDKVGCFIEEFKKQKGTIKCLDLLDGCNLSTEEGKIFFKDNNLRERCRGFIRLACELLEHKK